jgi:hypothetical protein
MTAVFDDSRQDEADALYPRRTRRAHLGRWLADQWPKAAIALGIAMTLAWVAVLAWLLNLALNVF